MKQKVFITRQIPKVGIRYTQETFSCEGEFLRMRRRTNAKNIGEQNANHRLKDWENHQKLYCS